jgi:hypothetical protein
LPPPREEGEGGEAAADARERVRVEGRSWYIFGEHHAYSSDAHPLIKIRRSTVKNSDVASVSTCLGQRV